VTLWEPRNLAFLRGCGVPRTLSLSCLSSLISPFLAFGKCPATAIDALRLEVRWNHVEGVVARCASPRASVNRSLLVALTPRSRCQGEFVASARAHLLWRHRLVLCSMVVWSVGIAFPGAPKNLRATRLRVVNCDWDEGTIALGDCSNCACLSALLLHGRGA
jgi:hypothetical protein